MHSFCTICKLCLVWFFKAKPAVCTEKRCVVLDPCYLMEDITPLEAVAIDRAVLSIEARVCFRNDTEED
jgi:hypothetical protein